jgi:hypothetical protein
MLTSFQTEAQRRLGSLLTSLGVVIREEIAPDPAFEGEQMLVWRSLDSTLTVWIYEDGIDYRIDDELLGRLEKEEFSSGTELIGCAEADLRRALADRRGDR